MSSAALGGEARSAASTEEPAEALGERARRLGAAGVERRAADRTAGGEGAYASTAPGANVWVAAHF
jgi:hypothetical protein